MAIGESAGLLLKIKADSTQASTEIKKFKQELDGIEKSAKQSGTALEQIAAKSGLSAAQFSGLQAAALGVAAIGTAAVTASAALFALTKQSADYGAQIFDATQKTGLSAQTISALRFSAEQAGSSFEQVTKGVSVFGAEVGKAAAGNDEAVKKMRLLGVTSNDLETALGQAFKTINEGTTDVDRLNLASEAFGKRIGPDLIPLIKDANGDLKGMIETAKKLGVTLTTEDVKAADAFGDSLDLLTGQAKIVGSRFTTQLMPEITQAMNDISNALANNQTAVREWGEEVRKTLSGLKNISTDLYNFSQTLPGRALSILLFGHFQAMNAGLQAMASPPSGGGNVNDQYDELRDPKTFAPSTTFTGADEIKKQQEDAKKEAEKAQKEAEDLRKRQLQGQLGQINAMQAAEEHALERITAANKAAFDARAISAKEYLERRMADEEEFAKGAIEDVTREYELKRKQEKLSSEQLKALKIEEDNELQKIVDTRYAREEEAKKQAAEQTKRISKEELDALEADGERKIAFFEAEAAKRYAVAVEYAQKEGRTEEDLAKFKQFLDEDTLRYRIDTLKKYLDRLDKSGKEYLDLQNKIKILEEQLEELRAKNHVADMKRHDERIQSWNKYVQAVKDAADAEDEKAARDAARQAEEDRKKFEAESAGGALQTGIFGELPHIGLQDVFGDQDTLLSQADFIKNVWTDLQTHIGGAIGTITSGLAQMAAAWLATGKFSAQAALQMASSVALSLAMQAGVSAIMELARGWAESAAAAASAAVFDYHGAALHSAAAAMHFSAAAIYGTVAGVAAIAGVGFGLAARAAGGGGKQAQGQAAFQQQSRTDTGGPRDGQGSVYSSQKDVVTEQGRNAPMGLRVRVTDDSTWLGKMLKFEIENNSGVRTLIKGVAEG